ncbi:hypothetical protein H1R20_g14804, partial [Candolleomyces eurysporus]
MVKQNHTLDNLHATSIKIQTEGTITPQDTLEEAASKLIGTISDLEAKFRREFTFKGSEADGTGTADDPYGTGTA